MLVNPLCKVGLSTRVITILGEPSSDTQMLQVIINWRLIPVSEAIRRRRVRYIMIGALAAVIGAVGLSIIGVGFVLTQHCAHRQPSDTYGETTSDLQDSEESIRSPSLEEQYARTETPRSVCLTDDLPSLSAFPPFATALKGTIVTQVADASQEGDMPPITVTASREDEGTGILENKGVEPLELNRGSSDVD